ncbi:Zinc finger GRF-type protein [Arachis hypogaea]|nr:Zinc finger GRF-type protein [Arachis hypogaea]
MLGSNSQGSGSSSRARSHGGWVKNAHRDRERPFYGCRNYNITGKRWCGFFKWADVEEEEAIVGRNDCVSYMCTLPQLFFA